MPFAPCAMLPAQCPMRHALCSLRYAPCPTRFAPCAMPYAPCPTPHALHLKVFCSNIRLRVKLFFGAGKSKVGLAHQINPIRQ
jgi:hypothetical protein